VIVAATFETIDLVEVLILFGVPIALVVGLVAGSLRDRRSQTK
jgi:hypothetical protein